MSQQGANLFGRGVGRHVVVFRHQAQQFISNAPARQQRGVPSLSQSPSDIEGEFALFVRVNGHRQFGKISRGESLR
jgi:hypothetical protein